MLYLDTSLLVASLTREESTHRVQLWLESCRAGSLLVSHLVITEFSSALSRKVRTGQLDIGSKRRALAAFRGMLTDSLLLEPLLPEHFIDAAAFADQQGLGLRTGDALHLAVAAEKSAAMCTLDRRLAEAATTLGLEAIEP